MASAFAVMPLLTRGWEAFRRRPWLLLGVAATYMLIQAVTGAGDGEYDEGRTFAQGLVWLVVSGPLVGGALHVALRVVRGQDASYGMLFSGFQRFLKLLLIMVLFAVGSGIGYALLLVPGIIFHVGFWPVFLVAMETNLGVWDSFRAAWRLTRGYKWPLLGLLLALVAINLLGVLALVVGVVLTAAVSFAAAAAAYDALTAVKGDPERLVEPQFPPM